jgi:excisionase family DNA binding protein
LRTVDVDDRLAAYVPGVRPRVQLLLELHSAGRIRRGRGFFGYLARTNRDPSTLPDALYLVGAALGGRPPAPKILLSLLSAPCATNGSVETWEGPMIRLADRRELAAAHEDLDPALGATPRSGRDADSKGGAMTSPLMKVAEVAAYLRTTPKGIYSMIARGALPVTRIGRRVLVRRDVLERALDEKTVTSPSRR